LSFKEIKKRPRFGRFSLCSFRYFKGGVDPLGGVLLGEVLLLGGVVLVGLVVGLLVLGRLLPGVQGVATVLEVPGVVAPLAVVEGED